MYLYNISYTVEKYIHIDEAKISYIVLFFFFFFFLSLVVFVCVDVCGLTDPVWFVLLIRKTEQKPKAYEPMREHMSG